MRRHSLNLEMWLIVVIVVFTMVLPEVRSAGEKNAPTFTKDVAPIIFKNCLKCHQAGKLAPRVPLISYETVRPRAELIKQKVMTREMPPWPADPARSVKFRNDPRLNQQDIDTIAAWVNAGTPKGNDADLPPIPEAGDGWTHPRGLKPDVVISLPSDFHVPAEGAIPYVRVLVKVPFSEDKWVTASETKPSNPAVVHHMALTEVELPEGLTPSSVKDLTNKLGLPDTMFVSPAVAAPTSPARPDMLAIYTPGSTLEIYGGDTAKLLKGGKNMYVIFNIHYETTGQPETDRSSIALWFTPRPPTHQLFRVNGAGDTIIANGEELLSDGPGTKAEGTNVVIPPIPPFAENYELTGVTGYLNPVTIYQLQPHAHHRGMDFTYTAVYPDGREKTLLTVPRYDHRWQMAYELETPLKLPAGSKLVVTAHYDNSKMNMHNPAPEKPVYFRDMNQSWDEMFTPFIQYSIDRDSSRSVGTMPALHADAEKRDTPDGLNMGEAIGCLERDAGGNWLLSNASSATPSETQATTSAALQAAKAIPLASQRYQLVGVSMFKPLIHEGKRVAVKGILVKDLHDVRINVTSLQTIADICAK